MTITTYYYDDKDDDDDDDDDDDNDDKDDDDDDYYYYCCCYYYYDYDFVTILTYYEYTMILSSDLSNDVLTVPGAPGRVPTWARHAQTQFFAASPRLRSRW